MYLKHVPNSYWKTGELVEIQCLLESAGSLLPCQQTLIVLTEAKLPVNFNQRVA